MLQATHYASAGFPFAPDRDTRFATSTIVRPLPQPPSTFKREQSQESLSQYMDATPAGSLEHPQTPDQTRSTHSIPSGTASESASHQLPTKGPPLTTGRELRPSAIPNSTPTPDDAQPALESLAKKSHARRQPEGHIPRPRNAFILFRCDFVAQKKIPASVEPDHRNISRIVGRIWKAMSEEDRRPWVEEAKREREKHKRLYPQYRYSPSSTATAAQSLKEKRSHYQKVRESMGVLPAWEVTPRTGSPAQSSPSQPTQEQQPREVPQAETLPQMQDVPSGVPWRQPESLDCWGSAAPLTMSGELSSAQPVSWEALSQSQQDWPLVCSAEPHRCPSQGFSTPSPSQEVVPFDMPATSSHFDSPDPSPMQMTRILPPFMFVAGHHTTTTNPELPTFHYSPTVGDASVPVVHFADPSATVDDPALRYQSHPPEFEMNSENFFESPAWTSDPIDDIIRNIESGPSLDYASHQPNSFIGH